MLHISLLTTSCSAELKYDETFIDPKLKLLKDHESSSLGISHLTLPSGAFLGHKEFLRKLIMDEDLVLMRDLWFLAGKKEFRPFYS